MPAVNLWITHSYSPQNHGIEKSVVLAFTGAVTTHLLRNAILRYGWLNLPLTKGLPRLLLGVAFTCMIAGLTMYAGNGIFGREMTAPVSFAPARLIFVHIFNFGLLILPWTVMYVLYDYIVRARKEDLERTHLERRVKEMRQQADESGVDVDFIINSLNAIQSSIEENPDRSRAEITKFSNLLRKGYLNLTSE